MKTCYMPRSAAVASHAATATAALGSDPFLHFSRKQAQAL